MAPTKMSVWARLLRFACSLVVVAAPPPPGSTQALLPLLVDLLTAAGGGTQSLARLRRTAVASGQHVHPSVREIAALSEHNFERDLHRWAMKQAWRELLPHTYEFQLMVEGDVAPKEATHSAILPHELFASLHAQAPLLFEKLFTGGSENLRNWWEAERRADSCWYKDHEVVKNVGDPTQRVPIGIHGDDAGVQGEQQVLVITWGSVAVELPTLDSRLVFCMLRTADILDDGADTTKSTVFAVLRWSLAALSCGRFPHEDHTGRPFGPGHHPKRAAVAGRPLAGGMVGAWSEMRGDWKFLWQALHLQTFYLTNYVCHLCRAHKHITRLAYTNFARQARHRRTLVSCGAWMNWMLGAAVVSPLLLIPGFCIWRVHFDVMHTLDLGVHQVTAPSAMVELIDEQVWPGENAGERWRHAFAAYKLWCRANKIKSVARKRFDPKQWRKSKKRFPKISQKVAKAAALRSMVYWVAEVCAQHADGDHGRLRATMFAKFVEADLVMRRAGRHLSPAERERLASSMEGALVCNNALAAEAAAAGKRLWKLLPKHHAATHMCYDSVANPRTVQCYADEDCVGRAKKIYNACHGQTAPKTALMRYSILVGIRWWQELQQLVMPRALVVQ